MSYIPVTATAAAGNDTEVQINSAGSFGTDSRFTYTQASHTLNVNSISNATDTDFVFLLGVGTTNNIRFESNSGGFIKLNTGSAFDAILSADSIATSDKTFTFPNTTGTLAVVTAGGSTIVSGTYTPTLTNVANLDASTAYQCQYMRVGDTVTVSGRVDVDPTTPAAATQLGITLPIASALGATEDCAGTAFASAIAGQGAAIRADATNDRAEMVWVSADLTNQPMYFTFTYQII